MNKLLIITFLLTSVKCYAQTTRVAGSTSANAPVVYTQKGADDSKKKSIDSLAEVLRLEFKKALSDSFNTLLPIDNKTLIVQNGKAIAVTSVQSVMDSTTKVANNLASFQAATNVRLNSLEGWRTTTNSQIGEINIKVATIPTKAVSMSVSTTTTTTTTELKQ